MRRMLEFGKNILLLLLAAAIVVLTLLALPSVSFDRTTWLSRLPAPVARLFGAEQVDLRYSGTAALPLDAAQPLMISVKNTAGRFSCQYDFTALDGAYELVGATLGHALGTASDLQETTRNKLLAAVAAPGMVLRYPTELSVSVLSSWLGAQSGQTAAGDLFVLALQEDAVRLYLGGEDYLCCDTALRAEEFLQLLDSFRPDGSFFAFEDLSGRFAPVDSLSMISVGAPVIPAVSVSNPCDSRYATQAASALGFNPYGDSAYQAENGTYYFSEAGRALDITADGNIHLTSSDADHYNSDSGSDQALIETARSLLADLAAVQIGEARLYLSSFTRNGSETVCTFDYALSGIPILLQENAARVRFTGSRVAELSLQMKTYACGKDTITLLPAAQAAAIVGHSSLLTIFYADDGSGVLRAGWRA